MTDWRDWHRRYDDPSSVQSRRLLVVRRRIGEALDARGDSVSRVLSLCAGDGRDVIPELAARPNARPWTVLVDLDTESVRRARASARLRGLEHVEVREADAGLSASFDDVLPVDVLLLCGIFGNVPDDDIRRTLLAAPAMLTRGGFALWTRGRCDGPDLRPAVRGWVREAGLEEVAYDGEPELFGVGLARLAAAAEDVTLPQRLFTFFR